MDINLEEAKKTLRAAFDKADSNKNGYLEPNEAAAVLKELKVEVTDSTLKNFFLELDANHDGQISFEELLAWFLNRNNTESDVATAFKLRLINQIKKAHKNTTKGLMNHFTDISFGKVDEAKTQVKLNIQLGKAAKEELAKLNQDIEKVDGGVQVFIKIGANNPQEAKTQFEELIQQGRDLVGAMGVLPPSISLDEIKTQVTAHENHVVISIQYANQMAAIVAAQVGGLVKASVPEGDFSSEGSAGFYFANSPKTIFQQAIKEGSEKSIPDYFFEGMQFKIDGQTPDALTRQFSNNMSTALARNQPGAQVFSQFGTLVLGYRFNLHFEDSDACRITSLLPPFPQKTADLFEMLKSVPFDQLPMMMPPLGILLDLAENNLKTDITVSFALSEQYLMSLNLKTEGLKEIYQWATGKQ